MKIIKICVQFFVTISILFFSTYTVLAVMPSQHLEYPSMLSLQGGLGRVTKVKDPLDENNTCIKFERAFETGTSMDEIDSWLEYNNYKKVVNYDMQGRFSLKYRMYLNENVAFKTQFYGYKDGVNKELISLTTTIDGEFKVGAHTLFLKCNSKEWYDIEIIIDTDRSTACFYINDELMFSSENSSALKFATVDVDNFVWFRFLIQNSQFEKNVLLDDICISNLSGIADVADIESIKMLCDLEESKALNFECENTVIDFDARICNDKNILFVAGVFDENGNVLKIDSAKASQSKKVSIDLGKLDSKSCKIKCYVWQNDMLLPVENTKGFFKLETSAKNYGVIPQREVRRNLQEALDNIEDGGTLVIDPGKYYLTTDFGDRYCLKLSDKKNVNIVSEGAQFILKNQFSGFMEIENCDSINISGITVEYEKRPWEQGIVEEIDTENTAFVMKVLDNSGIFDKQTFINNMPACFMTVRDNDNPYLIKSNSNEHYLLQKVESMGEDLYKFYLGDWSKALITGGILELTDKVVVHMRSMSGSTFYVKSSSNVAIKDVSIFETGECAVKGAGLTGDIIIDNLNVTPREQNWVSSNADGVHLHFSRGKLVLKNSYFDSLSDDAVNIYQPPIKIKNVSGNLIDVENNSRYIKEGDVLVIYNYDSGLIKGDVTVLAVDSGIVTLESTSCNINEGDVVFIKNAMFQNSEITNNQFLNLRRYGLLLKCSDITVSDNSFKNTGSDAIKSEFTESEGFGLNNAKFLNNTIINCGYLRNGRQETSGAFSIKAHNGTEDFTHSNIVFSGNNIENAPKCGFYLSKIDGVVIDETNNIVNLLDGAIKVNVVDCSNVEIAQKFLQ